MDTKKCRKCGEVKTRDAFQKKTAAKDGLSSQCRKCCSEAKSRLHPRKSPKPYVGDDSKECVWCHVIKPNAEFWSKSGKRESRCKSCMNAQRNEKRASTRVEIYRPFIGETSRECSHCRVIKPFDMFCKKPGNSSGRDSVCRECKKVIYAKNKDYYHEYNKRYHQKHKSTLNARKMEYRAREENKQARRNREQQRRENDPVWALIKNVSRRLRDCLSSGKNKTTEDIVGCNAETLLLHLESTFVANYGILPDFKEFDIHIDHIVPVSLAKSDEDVYRLNHFTNLQLLFADDNQAKKDQVGWDLWECG
jgi:hypothetical protein